MEQPSLVVAISKLAAVGEQAGFTLKRMIDLLDDGLGVDTLLQWISWLLHGPQLAPTPCGNSARRVLLNGRCRRARGGSRPAPNRIDSELLPGAAASVRNMWRVQPGSRIGLDIR